MVQSLYVELATLPGNDVHVARAYTARLPMPGQGEPLSLWTWLGSSAIQEVMVMHERELSREVERKSLPDALVVACVG